MSIAPLRFSGISSFSDDFQAILDRTVSIASLPAKELEGYQQEILADKMALGSVGSAVSALASSLSSLAGLEAGGALSVSTNSSKVTATKGSGAAPGVYVLSDITSLAQSAVYTSTAGFPDVASTSVDPDGALSLVVDGVEHTLTLGGGENSLSGLRDAINAAGLGISATIVDSGAGANRYYLTLTAAEPGARTFELRREAAEPASNILSVTRAGSNAQFKLNGIVMTAQDNYVHGVIPGVDFVLNEKTTAAEQIEINAKTNRSPVVSALSGFVSAYNELASALSLHRGEAGGSLTGSGVVLDLARQLMSLTGVSRDGAIGNLADLGITLDQSGVMSLDSSVINGMDAGSFSEALDFLSSTADGLGAMAAAFESFSDPVSGTIQSEIVYLDAANDRYSGQLEVINSRVSSMQESLLTKLLAADSLLASLDSKRTLLDAVIESLNTVTNGKREG
jgi:flagellar hook-associated protein 2